MKGKRRCRMHGGKAGAPEGERNGAWLHGFYSERALQERLFVVRLLREFRKT